MKYLRHLYVQVLIAVVLGSLLGHYQPGTGVALQPLGEAFIKLVKMLIGPIVFCAIVSGIGGMRDLHKVGRVEYVPITDDEAMQAFQQCCRLEGIIPALESSHALAEAFKRAPSLPKDHLMVVNLSGRGDKDMQTVMHYLSLDEKAAEETRA